LPALKSFANARKNNFKLAARLFSLYLLSLHQCIMLSRLCYFSLDEKYRKNQEEKMLYALFVNVFGSAKKALKIALLTKPGATALCVIHKFTATARLLFLRPNSN